MKLPVIRSNQLIKILERRNCLFKRQTGSHRIFYCPESKRIIVVPIHNKPIKKGLLRSIIKDLDLSVEEFNNLLKE
jgi:predicted RNA binding protein YcfA (HicA-like mRNA interferase family)